MKSQEEMKPQKEKWNLKKKKWKQNIFRTQKMKNWINFSVRQCQSQTMPGCS